MQSRAAAAPAPHDLYLLAVNLTRRCNLACAHCYLDASTLKAGDADELTTPEVRDLLDEVAARSNQTMVVLTGGEPLLRADLEELVAHGSSIGLLMVVGSNGMALTDRRAAALVAAGAMGVGISVDSLDPDRHDRFRGLPGAWQRTMDGIEACKRHGLPFQIHFSVTQANADEVPAMIDFARAAGARVLNVFFLVCTGRGESMSDIAPDTYERVLGTLVAAQETSPDLLIRARCAPHFKRVAYQRDPASSLTRAAGYEGGGCLAGIHYARVAPDGDVTACPYIPEPQGNIRAAGLWAIWDRAPQFQALRAPALQGKCGACEFRLLCGGCRARPLALGGALMETDPWCVHAPDGSPVIEPLREQAASLAWSETAQARLARVPPFLRKMVGKRAEDYVRGLGEAIVTPEHLATLSARRFGSAPPGRPGMPGMPGAPETPGTPRAQGSPQPPGSPAPSCPQGPAPLPWSEQARERLAAMPPFLQPGVQAVAEDVAHAEGRLEVNVKLLDRLLAEDAPARTLAWSAQADAMISGFVAGKPPPARIFVAPALEAAAEQFARRRRAGRVDAPDAQAAIDQLSGGVEWDADALARVLAAPEFNRAGIKKAAEFAARREGRSRISSDDLTRYRNRAMMRAVQRMKGFGMRELSFDAYEIARERVPRLKNNPEADQRFDAIRRFVAARPNPGDLLGKELLAQMKAELRDNPRAAAGPSEPGPGPGDAVDGPG